MLSYSFFPVADQAKTKDVDEYKARTREIQAFSAQKPENETGSPQARGNARLS
jgi:hypothetical protein